MNVDQYPFHPSAASAFLASALVPTTCVWIKRYVLSLSKLNNDQTIRNRRSLLHEKFHVSKVPNDLDYIIIGSGMSGLTCAAILSRLGRRVVVLEQHNDVAGGGTHMFDLKGYRFDSGLHYTVPWSIPLFALTCLKKPKDCLPFDLMTEADGTIDKIFLVGPDGNCTEPFRMKFGETHLRQLYEMFPGETKGINWYLKVSSDSMHFVKAFLLSKLFPKWLQTLYWQLVPSRFIDAASITAKDLLPRFIGNKKLASLLSSMWIDTGARPDRASFMLTASVFRGISMEGGCYPRGGSVEMAKELVTVIESNGGKVLIRSDVEQMLFDKIEKKITGVLLRTGQRITSKYGVVSSTGYLNTMNNLVPAEILRQYGMRSNLPISQSAGFVMVNIGINLPPTSIDATKANTWHIPVDENGDSFSLIEEYFSNPLKSNSPIPAFITFPCLKDSLCNDTAKTSCQMLLMAEYEWFRKFKPIGREDKEYFMDGKNDRLDGYEEWKALWKDRCVDIFLRHFPKAQGHISMVDVSSPLTIEHYLRATLGGAVGLDVCPERFCNAELRNSLDPISKIPGLALTGQDIALCGVTLCQLSGVITAFRLEGLCAALKIILQSIILGN